MAHLWVFQSLEFIWEGSKTICDLQGVTKAAQQCYKTATGNKYCEEKAHIYKVQVNVTHFHRAEYIL